MTAQEDQGNLSASHRSGNPLHDLDTIYNSVPVGLCVLDRELRFVRVNARLAEINGIPAAEHIGRRVYELLPELAEMAEPLLYRVLETGEALYNVEIRGQTPAKHAVERTWLEHFVPLLDDHGEVVGINITVQEITARKQAESALRERQTQLQMALEGARLGLWWTNLQTGETFWDARTREIFGVDAGAMATAERGLALIHPEDRDNARAALERARAPDGDGLYEEEKRIIRPDGALRWIATKGQTTFVGKGAARQALCLTGVVGDVSAQKEARALLEQQKETLEAELARRQKLEKAVRESEARFRELANAMPQLVWMARPDGTVDYYNRRSREYAGLKQDGEAWVWEAVLHPEDVPATVAVWEQAVATGEPYEIEHRVAMADGNWRWHLSRAMAARDEAGEIIRWYGTATDVHVQHLAAQELEGLNRTLEERVEKRTAQVRQLAAALTRAEQQERRRIAQILHDDLQQMLVALKVKLHLQQSEAGAEGLTLHALEQDIDDILEIARTLTGSLNSPGVISDRLVEALSWVTTFMEERYGLVVQIEVASDYRVPDQDLREIVVSMVRELLFNVVKHAGVKQARLSIDEDEEHLLIEVVDQGTGFDAGTITAGDGFGLYSVGERLRLFGGRLEVEAEPGEGTRMRLIVPKSQ